MPLEPDMLLSPDDSPLLPPRMAAHPARLSATASMPARNMLWFLFLMILSLWWMLNWMRDDAACHFSKRQEARQRSTGLGLKLS